MSGNILQIKQLAHRLESTVSSDRVEALQELQTLSRSDPATVGEHALSHSFKILREQSNPEEYAEVLDLASRLISCSDTETASKSASIILSDPSNIELLLELLEHEDMTVGVMTSQILTELHATDGNGLENTIQQCPDGMIKLLQRLPDSSREEVRNQAIVLIQQLTTNNEEMKKTVAFNEGFEILFRIIRDEGGSRDAGLVICDCLRICSNLLAGSETCQRLFFAMGTEWILRLTDFFDPALLENPDNVKTRLVEAEDAVEQFCWFEESNRVSCAILALTALAHALQPVNIKHQSIVLDNATSVIQHAGFWVARGGPSELVSAALSVLLLLCSNNVPIAQTISTSIMVKITPASKGRNVPPSAEVSPLLFGWRAMANDESRYVSPLSLFAERYIHPTAPWDAPNGRCFDESLGLALEIGVSDMSGNFQQACLKIFSSVLSADSSVPDIMIQFVLAPPPPPMSDMDDDESFGTGQRSMETMKPIGAILVNMVSQVCEKTLSANQMYAGLSASNLKADLDTGERALHLLSIVFLNASQLGRELITAISNFHLKNLSLLNDPTARGLSDHQEHKQILSFFLASVGKAARLPGGAGYSFLTCLLQLLAVIANGCEKAVMQMFDDPANLFVVDLATASSELAGVPASVQLAVCFFLGCCFTALPKDKKEGAETGDSGSILQRKHFLAMIDSKVGLNRFTDTLKRPSMIAKKQHVEVASLAQYGHYFSAIESFSRFFTAQTEAIKSAIFELYSGVDTNDGIDSVHQQVIQMQQEKIKELESRLENGGAAVIPEHMEMIDKTELEQLRVKAKNKDDALSKANEMNCDLEEQIKAALADAESTRQYLQEVEKENKTLRDSTAKLVEDANANLSIIDNLKLEVMELRSARERDEERFSKMGDEILLWRDKSAQTAVLLEENGSLVQNLETSLQSYRSQSDAKDQQVINLKQSVLVEAEAKCKLADQLEKKEVKMQLLEKELFSLRESLDASAKNMNHLPGLDELRKELREKESLVQKLNLQIESANSQAEEKLALQSQEFGSQLSEQSLIISNLQRRIEELSDCLVEKEETLREQFSAVIDDSTVRELKAVLKDTISLCNEDDIDLIHADVQVLDKSAALNDETAQAIISILGTIYSCIITCAGMVSDITEGANVELQGREGSLFRIVTSCEALGRQLIEFEDMVKQNDPSKYEDEIARLRVEMENLLKEKEDLICKVQDLEINLDNLNTSQAGDSMSREELQEKTQKLFQENKTLKNMVDIIKTERNKFIDDIKYLSGELEAKRTLENELKGKLDETEAARNAETQALYREREALQDELKSIEIKLQTLDKVNKDLIIDKDGRIEGLFEEITALQSALNQSERKQMELARLLEQREFCMKNEKHSLEILQEQSNSLGEKIKNLEAEKIASVNMQQALEQTIASKEMDLSVKADELLRLTRTKESLELNISSLFNEISGLQATISRLEDNNYSLKQKFKTEIDLLKSQLAEYQALFRGKVEEVSILEDKLEATAEAKEAAHSEVSRLGKELQEQQERAFNDSAILSESFEKEKEAWQQQLNDTSFALQSTEQSLKAEVEELKARLEEQKEKAQEAASSLALKERNELVEKVEQWKKSHEEAEAKLENLVNANYVLQESNVKLREAKEQLYMEMQGHLSELRQSHDNADLLYQKIRTLEKELSEAKVNNKGRDRVSPLATANFQQRISYLESALEGKDKDLMEKDDQIKKRQREMDQMKAIINKQVEEIKSLKELSQPTFSSTLPKTPVSASKWRRSAEDLENSHGPNGFTAQEHELKRISATSDRMSKELIQKETDLRETVSHLRSKEGELAGLKMSFESVKEEIRIVRQENDKLLEEKMAQDQMLRQLSGKIDVLKSTSFSDPSRSPYPSTNERSMVMPRTALVELTKFLQNIESQYGTKRSTWRDPDQDLTKVVVNLQSSVQEALAKLKDEIYYKDKELSALRAGARMNNGSSVSGLPTTPYRTTPRKVENTLVTPTKQTENIRGSTQDSLSWSSIKSAIQTTSPSASGAARLHAELHREKKKLHSLEEEHTDLLGLLAQQEVELSVYRQALTEKIGNSGISSIEKEAKENVTRRYGSYNNVRDLN